jgi:hypothetical protein
MQGYSRVGQAMDCMPVYAVYPLVYQFNPILIAIVGGLIVGHSYLLLSDVTPGLLGNCSHRTGYNSRDVDEFVNREW